MSRPSGPASGFGEEGAFGASPPSGVFAAPASAGTPSAAADVSGPRASAAALAVDADAADRRRDDDRYLEGGELGRGGMGLVTAALDRRLGRLVACKRPLDPDSATLRARLLREAAITAYLEHPGVVPVYDAGVDGEGQPFYAMRLIRGESLEQRIAATPQLQERLRLLRRLLAATEAVAYAHARGVIHRDLKPANILLGPAFETLVVDWGLARLVGPALGAVAPRLGAGREDWVGAGVAVDGGGDLGGAALTRDGTIVGTPGFAAPEVLAGAAADARADVFALGVTLAVLTSGRLPAPDRSPVAEAQLGGPELAAIVAKATDVEPERRYADAAALARDLDALLEGRRVSAHRYRPAEAMRRVWGAYRAPLLVGFISLVIFVVYGVASIREIRQQRDAAVAARSQEERARLAASHSLGLAWLAAARGHAVRGGWPEAEVLAAAALTHLEAPEARGILMRARQQRAALAAGEAALPADCGRPRLAADAGALLCLGATAATLYELDRADASILRLRWRRPGHVPDGWLGGAAAWLASSLESIAPVDRATGRPLAAASMGPAAGGWMTAAGGPTPAAAAVLPMRGDAGGLAWVAELGRPLARLRTCVGAGTVAFARAPVGGEWPGAAATVCQGGAVEVYSAANLAAAATATADRAAPAAPSWVGEVGLDRLAGSASAAAFSADGAALWIGTQGGQLLRLALPEGAVDVRLELAAEAVTGISVADAYVAVAVEGGAITVIAAAAAVPVLRLPAGSVGEAGPQTAPQLAWAGDGCIWTVGVTLRRWCPPRPGLSLSLPGRRRDHGIAAISPSHVGDAVAIALADGRVQVWPLDGGPPQLDVALFSGVSKFVDLADDGASLLAAGPRPPGVVELKAPPPAAAAAPWTQQQPWRIDAARRVGVLASGARLAVGYDGAMSILDLDALRPADHQQPRRHVILGGEAHAAVGLLDLSVAPGRDCATLVDATGGIHRVDDARRVHVHPLRTLVAAEVAAPARRCARIAVGAPGRVSLLDREGRTIAEAVAGVARLHDVAFGDHDRLIATGGMDGVVRVFEAGGLALRASLHAHRGRVSSVAFAHGAPRLFSAGWDGTVALYHLDALQLSAEELSADASRRWRLELEPLLTSPMEP